MSVQLVDTVNQEAVPLEVVRAPFGGVIMAFDSAGVADGAMFNFAGRDTVGDGGGGLLRFAAGSTATADGVTIYAPTGGGRLFREGFVGNVFCLPVRPEWAGGATDDAKVAAAISAGYEVVFSPKTYTFADEVAIDKSVKLTFASANEYGVGGTVIHITHNDANKSGFKVGYNSNTIRFETEGEVKFTAPAGSASFAGINCKAATVFIDGVRGTVDVNGLYIENGYIGYVKRLQGPCKNYLGKVAGDSSLRWETLNLGGNTGGLSSFQIVTTAGFTQIEHIYLEAQATASLAIDDTARSAVSITNVYGENAQQYDILINNAENVTIENYRTNSNTESIKVRASSNVRINNVLCVDRLAPNEIVDVDAASSGIYVGGVLYDPVSNDGTAIRTYAIIRGLISGAPAQQMIVNAELQPSAGGQVSTVGGSVTTAIPADQRMRIGTTSVAVTDSTPIKIPFTDWAAKTAVVIQCIYKTAATAQTAVAIQAYKAGSTQLLNINDFHVPSADWQMVTIVTRLPDVASIDQYSTLRFVCDTGVTADVHMLTCSRYDGGMLPFGVDDDSILLMSDSVSLNTAGSRSALAPRLGGASWRFKQYELVYTGNTGGSGALGTVAVGDANTSGVLAAASANFTTALNSGVGAVCTTLAATGPYPFADHANTTANGWVVEVTGAAGHGGTARAYIRAVKSKYAL